MCRKVLSILQALLKEEEILNADLSSLFRIINLLHLLTTLSEFFPSYEHRT